MTIFQNVMTRYEFSLTICKWDVNEINWLGINRMTWWRFPTIKVYTTTGKFEWLNAGINVNLSKGLINKQQHGFISKHSTVTNLLENTYDWSLSFHGKQPVDVIYVDFSRAFDSVVHPKLIHKLRGFGINGLLLKWVEAFLYCRSQCVVVENHYSSW